MLKQLIVSFFVTVSLSAFAQSFEPKWVGEVKFLTIENDDTVSTSVEKANIQVKTTQSAGRLLVGIGNVRQKVIIKGAKSPLQVSPTKPFVLVVKCKDNDIDPTTFINVIKFEEKRKERRTELAMKNWVGNVSEGNMKLVPFTADQYGKSSYILTIQPQEGEFGIRIVNPNVVDEKITILYCFGSHSDMDDDSVDNSEIPLNKVYEIDGVKYPVYMEVSGARYIYKVRNRKHYIPEDAPLQ